MVFTAGIKLGLIWISKGGQFEKMGQSFSLAGILTGVSLPVFLNRSLKIQTMEHYAEI